MLESTLVREERLGAESLPDETGIQLPCNSSLWLAGSSDKLLLQLIRQGPSQEAFLPQFAMEHAI